MIMPNEYEGRGGHDIQSFGDVIGEIVQEYSTEIPAIEIIGILEAAKACVMHQAIKELRDEE